jgi:hypothetical protein
MLRTAQLHAQLERMEAGLAETRRQLCVVERQLENRAEAETIRRRPKARSYHRRMMRWTGADEAEYRRVLDAMLVVTGPELDRLRRRAERQDAAIENLRRKYRVNAERPYFSVW